jgi:hypothetical protein
MAIQTFLGPILSGTQKNNNPAVITSSTPSATFLQPGTGGSYRNTGAGDALQFVNIPASVLTAIPAASFPYTLIPTYSVQGVNYPIVVPAGAYIDNIDLNVYTALSFSGSPTGFQIAVQLIGAPGSTYATAQTIANIGSSANTTVLPAAGNYALGNTASTIAATNPIVASNNVSVLTNTGPTDMILQLVMTFTGGTTPAISGGSIGFMVSYVVRSPDGSWYPQTPPVPYSTPSPATY